MEEETPCSCGVRAFRGIFNPPYFFQKKRVISSQILFSPNMSTKLFISDVSNLLKQVKGGSNAALEVHTPFFVKLLL